MTIEKDFDITKPLWDLNTFYGRWRHYAWVTNPMSCFVYQKDILAAKQLYDNYRYYIKYFCIKFHSLSNMFII